MNASAKSQLAAAIELGSHALSMKIVEIGKNMEIKTLESLSKPVELGKDTFATGWVSFETLVETCEILKGFKKLMADYNVKIYRAVATTAVREAVNREYIVDQIKLKTGLDIDVIGNSTERYFAYNALREHLPNYKDIRKEGGIIIDIGFGSTQVYIMSNDRLEESINIKLGSLRVREILSALEGRTLNFPRVLDEFIAGKIDTSDFFKNESLFRNIVLIGGDVKMISKLNLRINRDKKKNYIMKKNFCEFYQEMLYKSPRFMMKELGLELSSAEILLPTMMIFKKFLDKTAADRFYTPLVNIMDGLIVDICRKRICEEEKDELEKDALSLARSIAGKFKYDKAHAEDVEKNALILFDETRKLHGLGKRERLLLQLASILHDSGKFISLNEHYMQSYNIILASEIPGITRDEQSVIANVARYHSGLGPELSHPNFALLSDSSKLTVAKLSAIIRIADALDRSHKQKVRQMKAEWDSNRLIIRVETAQDMLLEEWTFETKAEFFKVVFGVIPEIKIKKVMMNA
jgi:exopolyphosphatase / guanosine-5'-triphosphate,3'-diphosphate pyrophosphatase